MTLFPSAIPSAIARVGGLATLLRARARRILWMRVNLQGIPPAGITNTGPGESVRWLANPTIAGAQTALECPVGSQVTWDVQLPSKARVVCRVAVTTPGTDVVGVEFEIRVLTRGGETSVTTVVGPSPSRLRPRSNRLQVRPRPAGPARIMLSSRLTAGSRSGDARALWLDPRIESRRGSRRFAAAVGKAVSRGGLVATWRGLRPLEGDRLYDLWVREREASREALQLQAARAKNARRVFSLVTFVRDPSNWDPRPAFTSLAAQSYPRWEWIVVGPTELTGNGLGHDERVRAVGGGDRQASAAAWNHALGLANGEFFAVIGQHDTLSPSALYEVAAEIDRRSDVDVVYSDEDRIRSSNGRRYGPRFKPAWSPELLLAGNYIGRLAMIRVATARAARGFRDGFDGLEEWELLLRLSRAAKRFRRLPRCLYHRIDSEVSIAQVQLGEVLREHYAALGVRVESAERDRGTPVRWRIDGRPKVSVIMPNRDAAGMVKQSVNGLIHDTTYPDRELVIVDNGSTEPEVLDFYRWLAAEGLARIVPFNRPFNYSAACNLGAAASRGELLLFLNNDIEVIHPEWLTELVRWVQLPGVGIVGAKLLFPDHTIQHAGVVFGLGLVGHIFSRAAESTSGVFGSTESSRNYLAVTGACQMIRRDVFTAIGGYDERFRLSFSDVVLCLEAWKAGYRVVYTPDSRLIHHESYTRKRKDSPKDMEHLAMYLRDSGFVEDPYFHPELDPRAPIPAVRPPFDLSPAHVIAAYIDRVLGVRLNAAH